MTNLHDPYLEPSEDTFHEAEQYGQKRALRYLREWLVNKVRYGAEPVTADMVLERIDLMLAGVEKDNQQERRDRDRQAGQDRSQSRGKEGAG